MSLNEFGRQLGGMLFGRSEQRFARELARTLGVRVREPESGAKPAEDSKTEDGQEKRV
jgi:hypothetical protein